VQDFVWSDFTAKPDHKYVYNVIPIYGQPKNLQFGPAIEVEVDTESEAGSMHSVYFNRGVIGSQASCQMRKPGGSRRDGRRSNLTEECNDAARRAHRKWFAIGNWIYSRGDRLTDFP
jgi:hypothetical protein